MYVSTHHRKPIPPHRGKHARSRDYSRASQVRGVNGRPTPRGTRLKCPPFSSFPRHLRQLRVSAFRGNPFPSTPLVAAGIPAPSVSLSRPFVRRFECSVNSRLHRRLFLLPLLPSTPPLCIFHRTIRDTLFSAPCTSHHRPPSPPSLTS